MTTRCCRCKQPMTLDPYLAALFTRGAVALHEGCAREGHREARALIERLAEPVPYRLLPTDYSANGGNARKIPPSEYAAIYARWKAGERQRDIGADYGVHKSTISDACARHERRLREGASRD